MNHPAIHLLALRTLAFAVMLAAGTGTARAATYTWTGNDTGLGSDNWSQGLNWANEVAAVSASSTDVIFGALGGSKPTTLSYVDTPNPFTLHQEIEDALDDAIARADPKLATLETLDKGHGCLRFTAQTKRPPRQSRQPVDKSHGCLDTRRFWQSEDIGWFTDRGERASLQSVGVVEVTREVAGKVSRERCYYLSSLPVDVALLARAVRGHWAVENNLHWVLDVVFGEDQSPARVHGLCRGQPGRGPSPSLEPPAPRQHAVAFHQMQTAPHGLRHQLPGSLLKF